MRIMRIRSTQAVADRSGDIVVFVGAQDFKETTCKSHGMHWPSALDEDQRVDPSM